MDAPIATRQMLYISPHGENRGITLSIGAPHVSADGDWACPVALDGFIADINDIHGIDSWQAVTAAIAFLKELLEGLMAKHGGTLRYVGDEEAEIDLSRLFAGGA